MIRLEGQQVYLRPVVMEDATERYASWLRDPEVTRFLESGSTDTTLDTLRDYIGQYEGRTDVLFLAIIDKSTGLHIGNVKLDPINFNHSHAVLGILIGEPGTRGRGLGEDVLRLVLAHAFGPMGLHRVALGVVSDNLPAIRCYQKVGFRVEGVFRESVRRNESFIDGLWMAILAHEFNTDRS